MSQSEIARMRQQIDAEYEAAQHVFTSPSMVARHRFITARMEHIANNIDQLREQVGEEQALQMMCEAMDRLHAEMSTTDPQLPIQKKDLPQ